MASIPNISRLCLATSYTSSFADFGAYCARSLHLYAARWGCSVHVVTDITIDRPAAWHRVRLIPELFDRGHEFVLWVDADAIFMRFDKNILAEVVPDKDLYLVAHDHPGHPSSLLPNTGVMLVRNTEWSRALFDRIWSLTQYTDHPWWENAAMLHVMGYRNQLGEGPYVPDEEVISRVRFLDEAWNHIPVTSKPGPAIIRHYAGQSGDVRRRDMPRDAAVACRAALGELAPDVVESRRPPARMAAAPSPGHPHVLTNQIKQRLWDWFGTAGRPAEWDGRVYGGGKISQRFWEYFIAAELLNLSPGDVVLDIGGGSPATGLCMFPRLLASVGIQVIVLDVNFGDMLSGAVENTVLVQGLADRERLSEALRRYQPSHVSCVSVLEHASAEQQRGIFDALEDAFDGVNAVFTLEFHETDTHWEQQLTTKTLSAAVSGLRRYYLDRVERSPMHCVNALSGKDRLWYPLALKFGRSPYAQVRA